MTYWRMTNGVRRHEAIAPDEEVFHASYGLSRRFVNAANRVADPNPAGGVQIETWSTDMGAAEGMAAPLRDTGVVALTSKRLLFFKKRFAIGRAKNLTAEWPIGQVTSIEYDRGSKIMMVKFADGSGAGLHVPPSQSPQDLAAAFQNLTAR